jgi:hypothetical protein
MVPHCLYGGKIILLISPVFSVYQWQTVFSVPLWDLSFFYYHRKKEYH